jgi:hypothetical protein
MARPQLSEEDIERRLHSHGAKTPQPPAKLLDQLKAEIPEGLSYTNLDRQRPAFPMWRGTWAVAASIIVLVSLSYVMLKTMESSQREQGVPVGDMVAPSRAKEAVPAAPAAQPPAEPTSMAQSESRADVGTAAAAAPSATSAPKTEMLGYAAGSDAGLRQEMDELQKNAAKDDLPARTIPEPVEVSAAAPPRVAPQQAAAAEEGKVMVMQERESNELARRSANQAPSVAGGVVGGVMAAPAPAAPAPTPAADRASAPQKMRARLARDSDDVAGTGQFVDAEADPVSTFALRVGDQSYGRVRSALAAGKLPSSETVREEEILNHFDYGDDRPRADVAVTAEGAAAPFAEGGLLQTVRIGVRTRGGSPQRPLGTDAKVQVDFNPDIVRSYRLVGHEAAPGSEARPATLPFDHAVSALYELRLERRPGRGDRIASIRLQYQDAQRRERVEVTRDITGSDFSPNWEVAPPTLRLATLVAKWAELLKDSPFAAAVDARELFVRAQRLSGELAGDEKVADFVSLAAKTASLMER